MERRLTPDQEIAGSIPAGPESTLLFFIVVVITLFYRSRQGGFCVTKLSGSLSEQDFWECQQGPAKTGIIFANALGLCCLCLYCLLSRHHKRAPLVGEKLPVAKTTTCIICVQKWVQVRDESSPTV